MIIRGRRLDAKLYKLILEKFEAFAPQLKVQTLKRSAYLLTRDRWRLSSSPSLRDGGTLTIKTEGGKGASRTVKVRLQDLENLKTSNKITDKEYRDLRRKILNDL
jgi:hypothetical protein